MSSRTQPSPVPSLTQHPDAQLSRAGRASQAITGRGSGATPRRLRLARLVHVLVALALGAGVLAVGLELQDREATAGVHAAQYKRAVSIETTLKDAQASAGGTPASGSALPEKTRDAIDTATTTLIEIAASSPEDTVELADIGHLISRYTETLAAGRQSDAGKLLDDELLPAVQQLQAAHNAEATTAVTWWMWLVPVGGWLAVAGLVALGWFTARISHRLVNVGLLIAAVATGVVAATSGQLLATHAAGTGGGSPFQVGVVFALISLVAGAWGLHQRLKEYR